MRSPVIGTKANCLGEVQMGKLVRAVAAGVHAIPALALKWFLRKGRDIAI